MFVHEPSWYPNHDVDLPWVAPSTRSTSGPEHCRPRHHGSGSGSGEAVAFDVLVLATGSSPRRLDVPGVDLSGVHHLRTLDDSRQLHTALAERPRVVLIGGGWIGLEVAAAAVTLGGSVTVLEAGGMPLGAVLGERMAAVLVEAHRAHGVEVRTHVDVAGLTDDGAGRVTGVELRDGTHVPADLVVVGVGATPNVELARAMGLAVDNGVLTDEYLRTRPDVRRCGTSPTRGTPRSDAGQGRALANALNQPNTWRRPSRAS